jgi:hypothetical protein
VEWNDFASETFAPALLAGDLYSDEELKLKSEKPPFRSTLQQRAA